MKTYKILELKEEYVTLGLNGLLDREFSIYKGNFSSREVTLLIDYVLNYIETTGVKIKDKETFGCGSWLIKFVFNETYIEIHELKDIIKGENFFSYDVTISLGFLKSQLDFTRKYNVKMIIPNIGQKVAVSPEIYEGSEVNAVRYEAPDHMSGWYLTSNNFNGDVNSLLVDHLYHLLKKRPELAKFLALPPGYRFFKDDQGEEVWLDED